MLYEVITRRVRLLQTLEALRRSRREILRERNFKETVVEHIETGLLTYGREGLVTYANGPAQRLLGCGTIDEPVPMSELLEVWPEFLAALPHSTSEERERRWSDS